MTEIQKRNRRAVPIELDSPDDLRPVSDASPIDVEETALGHVFWEQLESKVAELPDSYRTVVVLRDVYGLSGEETGEILGITPGAVKVRLHRARKKLRDELASQFPEWVDVSDGDGEKETA
jgi:RNA polymerase sigma-70 factor (ECF subfamily)